MSFWKEDLRKLIEIRFKNEMQIIDEFNIDFGSNSKTFTPPKDGTPWVRLYHTIFENKNAQIGVGMQRVSGTITVQVFTKEFTGTLESNLILGEISTIFQNKNFNRLHISTMEPIEIGNSNGWFQQNAKFDFYYNVFLTDGD